MKKSIVLFGLISMVALASCTGNKKEEDKSTPPPVQAQPPAQTEQKEGTTIKMNNEGVSIESKDGGNKSNVKMTKDTTQIELSRPK